MNDKSPIMLCDANDIDEGACRGFELPGHNLFAVKKAGKIFLYYNRCPHAGLPLNWFPDKFLDRDGELIQCASHGALFQINNGHCVAGPCPGQKLKRAECNIINNKLQFFP